MTQWMTGVQYGCLCCEVGFINSRSHRATSGAVKFAFNNIGFNNLVFKQINLDFIDPWIQQQLKSTTL